MALLKQNIAIIGAGGTIGLSLSALLFRDLALPFHITVLDTKPDLKEHVTAYLQRVLPACLHNRFVANLSVSTSVADAVVGASIVYEAGPEDIEFKTALWHEVEQHAPRDCLFWSATTGIPASEQNAAMRNKERLIVVHCFNPPHILPLIELVPSPETNPDTIDQTLSWWRSIGRNPIVLNKEVPGFVAGRLAWALLREAISLVDSGVVEVKDVDRAIEESMGIRWAYQGPFKSFHAGGGPGGLEALMRNVGRTVQRVWDDLGTVRFGEGQWEQRVYSQCQESYGTVDQGWVDSRDEINTNIVKAARCCGKEKEDSR